MTPMTEIPSMDKLLGDPEAELVPELERYLTRLKNGMLVLQHPLVYSVPHFPQLNDLMNRHLKEKQEKLKQALRDKDYSTYVFAHERPYRLNGFGEVQDLLGDVEYWELLADIWTDSENIHQNKDVWELCLSSHRTARERFMSAEERKHFNRLPETLTIFRGCQRRNRNGLSWTLERDKAAWFAQRFSHGGKPIVLEKQVNKADVFAYKDNRNEREIILV
jgi:hypothetical protein